MTIYILTIFPEMFDCYFNQSIIKRAIKRDLIKIKAFNLRRWATDRHKTVDDRPYGGGPGMVMKIEPFYRALKALRKVKVKKERIILFSAKGKVFNAKDARRLSRYNRLILLCGRYEGVDERVKKFVDEEISIGNYVLTGGELPAMVLVDAVARHIPGVLGKAESLLEESFEIRGMTEYPQYTRPEIFKWKDKKNIWHISRVPSILLSGDHKKIHFWRQSKMKKKG